MNAEDLKKRTKAFALRILRLGAALPNTIEGRVIRGQLVRAGTSVGANYRAACRGRSRAEFVAKLGVVEEESRRKRFLVGTDYRGRVSNAKSCRATTAGGQ